MENLNEDTAKISDKLLKLEAEDQKVENEIKKIKIKKERDACLNKELNIFFNDIFASWKKGHIRKKIDNSYNEIRTLNRQLEKKYDVDYNDLFSRHKKIVDEKNQLYFERKKENINLNRGNK